MTGSIREIKGEPTSLNLVAAPNASQLPALVTPPPVEHWTDLERLTKAQRAMYAAGVYLGRIQPPALTIEKASLLCGVNKTYTQRVISGLWPIPPKMPANVSDRDIADFVQTVGVSRVWDVIAQVID